MPFTTSHPAIVLPLKKIFPRWVSLSGLIAGAMSPDLIYFLTTVTYHRGITHSWPGLFMFCLPMGILFTFAFHWLFKYHFIMNLPPRLDKYLYGLAVSSYRPFSIQAIVILVISVLIGALSHFFWDSFTHGNGVMVRAIPFLAKEISIFGIEGRIFQYLQMISSVIGGLFFLIYIPKAGLLPKTDKPFIPNSTSRKIWFWIFGIIFAIIFALAAVSIRYETGFFETYQLLPHRNPLKMFSIATWSGFFWYVAGYTLILRIKKRPL